MVDVCGNPDPFGNLLAELEIVQQRDREKDATGWLVVSVDEGVVVNATGPFGTPEAALIAQQHQHEMMAGLLEPGETPWEHVVVPMFAPEPS